MFGQSKNNQATNSDAAVDHAVETVVSQEPETVAPSTAPVSGPANDYIMTNLPQVAAPAKPAPTPTPTSSPVVTGPVVSTTAHVVDAVDDLPNDLIELKQSALQELTPLVGHLEQTPEEKFRTAMMMIQASDDQSLLPQAFAAAKNIEDEKARAQALLDVINEINYFTQQHSDAA